MYCKLFGRLKDLNHFCEKIKEKDFFKFFFASFGDIRNGRQL